MCIYIYGIYIYELCMLLYLNICVYIFEYTDVRTYIHAYTYTYIFENIYVLLEKTKPL